MPLSRVPPDPTPPPPARAPLRRLASLAAALGAAVGLGGCGVAVEPPLVLQIAVVASRDQVINGQMHHEFHSQQQQLVHSFRQLHPHIHFRFSLYPEDGLIPAMRERQRSGLGPDLLYVTNRTAHQLVAAGISEPFPSSAEIRTRVEPELLRLVSSADGSLAGLPLLQQLQISCFDNRRLPSPPTSLAALLAASAAGAPIGLSLVPENLFWTVGSTGALPAMERGLSGKPLSAEDRGALAGWLAWLADASDQQRVVFYASQEMAETELVEGRLAWIPCRSITLPLLRQRMGTRLGVAPLPDGSSGTASPVNHIRVMALGRNSTGRVRRAAIAFSTFAIKPLVQRAITLGSFTVLPVDRNISVPVSSSQTLAALVQAQEQGLQSARLMPLLRQVSRSQISAQGLISAVVFGELSPAAGTTRLIRLLEESQ